MTVAEALQGVTRLGVDTSALVDLVTGDPRSALAWKRIQSRVDEGNLILVGSTLLLVEALTTAFVLGRRTGIGAEDGELFERPYRRLESVAVSEKISRLAAELCIAYHLATTDAIHLATALETGCEAFLTVDSDFLRVRGYPLPDAPERSLRVILTRTLRP